MIHAVVSLPVGAMDDVLDCICPLHCRGDDHWPNTGMVSLPWMLNTNAVNQTLCKPRELTCRTDTSTLTVWVEEEVFLATLNNNDRNVLFPSVIRINLW